MKCPRWGLRCVAVAVSGLTVAATTLAGPAQAGAQARPQAAIHVGAQAAAHVGAQASPQAADAGPTVKLIAAQRVVTVSSFGGQVFFDPGIYVASLKSALVFHVQRASYTKPVIITQVIHLPDGSIQNRRLPASVRRGWSGLRGFLRLRVTNSGGKTVAAKRLTFCPNGYNPQRVNPNSPPNSPFPQQCQTFDPFPKGMVWGIQKGWAIDPFQNFFGSFQLAKGTYKVSLTITRKYVQLFHITARDATATVRVKVVPVSGCCGGPVPVPAQGPRARHGSLPTAPTVPYLRNPPRSALPDLVPLPSWGISTSSMRATKTRPTRDYLNFAATVWIGGNSPLDVEGFRSHGSPVMQAYQYFWRNGHIIGRARAGTMGFADYNHWHFSQFARYRLLNSAKALAVRSHKEGFCIAPTDPVDLLLPHATWQPSYIGLSGECGDPAALWVQELLPVGWADTYLQSIHGESFNITKVPNGTYYIQVIANPLGVIHESNTSNDISLRKVILGGTLGHRTVRVPAWHGIDPER